MQKKSIAISGLRRKNTAQRLMMKPRQAKAADQHLSKMRSKALGRIHGLEEQAEGKAKSVLASLLTAVRCHPIYSLLGATAAGLAAGYLIRPKK